MILSTDCGNEIDDQWAVAHLALSPTVDIRGIVGAHAPSLAAETAAMVVNDVLDRMPLTARPPVVAGSSFPLSELRPDDPNAGVDLILGEASHHNDDDRLTVLVIGPATDVALALRADPTLADRIRVVAMGFDAWPQGNDAFNVRNDIAAWQMLLETPVPLTVGDAAVCIRHLTLSAGLAAELLGDGDAASFLVDLLHDMTDRKPEAAREVTGDPRRWPIWDEVVVAHLLGLTKTETYTRPALGQDILFRHSWTSVEGDRSTVEWIVEVDEQALWADLSNRLQRLA